MFRRAGAGYASVMSSFIRKPAGHLFRVAALSFLWINRRDAARWARFAKRAAPPTTRPDPQDLKLEARVRASISADPILRVDPSIRDLRVCDGAVVLETPLVWHNEALALSRLRQVDGVESVRTARDVDNSRLFDGGATSDRSDLVAARFP